MKTILLMSCALCAGMNGYGMMVDSMRESNNVGLLSKSKTTNNETSLLSPKTDQSASSSKRTGGNRQSSVQEGQSKKICTKTEPEPPQKEFSVELSQAEWEEMRAYDQLSEDTGKTLRLLLNSHGPIDKDKLSQDILGMAIAYQTQLDKIGSKHNQETSEDSRKQNMRHALNLIRDRMIRRLDDLWYDFSGINPSNADTTRAQEILSILGDVPPDEDSSTSVVIKNIFSPLYAKFQTNLQRK